MSYISGRRLIVTDRSGRIVATGPHPEDVPEMRGKSGFTPLEGQHVHEVELPEQERAKLVPVKKK